ncbi:unnamed protein product [Polarella glacialis]|uniref:Uncharacterized protein n=1 Tax=Polarella glacialis TaxID=89957 RepID=A0A813K0D4_POLGL|nr:unnamed protein product [Polarella glacialis]
MMSRYVRLTFAPSAPLATLTLRNFHPAFLSSVGMSAVVYYIQEADGTLTQHYGSPPTHLMPINTGLPTASSMVATPGMISYPGYSATAPAATAAAPATKDSKAKKSSKKKKGGCC